MAEYFEMTFFLEKEKAEEGQSKGKILEVLSLQEGKNQVSKHQFQLFTDKEVLFDIFDEMDFFQYRICLSNLVFTKKFRCQISANATSDSCML